VLGRKDRLRVFRLHSDGPIKRALRIKRKRTEGEGEEEEEGEEEGEEGE